MKESPIIFYNTLVPTEKLSAEKINLRDDADLVNRGILRKNIGRLSAALVDFTQALRINSQNFSALLGKGEVLAMQQHFGPASKYFKKAILIQPCDQTALFYMGEAQRKLGKSIPAFAHLHKALQVNPNYTAALISRCKLYWSLGYSAEALSDINDAFAVDNNNQHTLLLRNNIYNALAHVEAKNRSLFDLTKLAILHNIESVTSTANSLTVNYNQLLGTLKEHDMLYGIDAVNSQKNMIGTPRLLKILETQAELASLH